MLVFDTETCGKHGPIILIQYALDDGSIIVYDVWKHSIAETIALIEMMVHHDGGIVGFNLVFDWFHICQLYTTLLLLRCKIDEGEILEDHIVEYALCESDARFGPCLKPKTACDLMLVARKGPYQSTMDRDEIRIRKVPTALSQKLADELNKRIPLKDIYFSKQKKKKRWHIIQRSDTAEFDDVALKFAASSALKTLATDALNLEPETVLLFADVDINHKFWPIEFGYAPFALAHGSPENWKGTWPEVIEHHIVHWAYNNLARRYAANDVDLTRRLYQYFGNPPMGDTDSILACAVGAIRWKGYRVDLDGIRELKFRAMETRKKAPTAPGKVRDYVYTSIGQTELAIIGSSTKKVILEEIADWKCHECRGEGCDQCDHTGKHKAAEKADAVLNARKAGKEVEVWDKILKAKRFHTSFNIVGARSGRMSGSDRLNPHGIRRTDETRSQFPLADDTSILCGGDFISFEVALADAVYNDPLLRKELQSGKKIHGIFGQDLFPDETYDSIVASKGSAEDMYEKGKRGFFTLIYGGDHHTMKEKIGIDLDIGEKAFNAFVKKYVGVARERKKIFDMFCSMRQPGGIGTQVEWHEPAEYIESLFGFRRYFALENQICKTLFELANNPPKDWIALKNVKVRRRDRVQTVSGAVQSALYGSAFQIQAANMRAAANHVIQSSGSSITKELQKNIWDLQPCGIGEWIVQPMNNHDEILCPTHPDYVTDVNDVVKGTIEHFRSIVPLIGMDWKSGMKSWAEK